jgi:hypothetical protein
MSPCGWKVKRVGMAGVEVRGKGKRKDKNR